MPGCLSKNLMLTAAKYGIIISAKTQITYIKTGIGAPVLSVCNPKLLIRKIKLVAIINTKR